MQDYKSLRVAVMICGTLVTHRQIQRDIQTAQFFTGYTVSSASWAKHSSVFWDTISARDVTKYLTFVCLFACLLVTSRKTTDRIFMNYQTCISLDKNVRQSKKSLGSGYGYVACSFYFSTLQHGHVSTILLIGYLWKKNFTKSLPEMYLRTRKSTRIPSNVGSHPDPNPDPDPDPDVSVLSEVCALRVLLIISVSSLSTVRYKFRRTRTTNYSNGRPRVGLPYLHRWKRRHQKWKKIGYVFIAVCALPDKSLGQQFT